MAIALPHQATADVKARPSSLFLFDGQVPDQQEEDLEPGDTVMADVIAAQEDVTVEGPLEMKDHSGPIPLSYIDFFPGRTGRSDFKYKYATFE